MAFTKEQKREWRLRKYRIEPRLPANKKEATLDTLNYFVVSRRRVCDAVLGRCDACDQPATITDGYMLICSSCDGLLQKEKGSDESSK